MNILMMKISSKLVLLNQINFLAADLHLFVLEPFDYHSN